VRVGRGDGGTLAVEVAGDGPPIVLLHGLTATRRYVVMGSTLLQRSGFTVLSYDARGHGESDPADGPPSYAYPHLVDDLEAVMDRFGVERALVAGASMGAHTAVAFALRRPQRVAALGVITPGFDPTLDSDHWAAVVDRWRSLAEALRSGGVEGFLAAYPFERVDPRFAPIVRRAVAQRLQAHRDLRALADAIEGVGGSRPFEGFDQLAGVGLPTVVVGSRDGADPDHPLALAKRYATALGGTLEVEPAGSPPRSPLAWQGGKVSELLLSLYRRAEAAA